MRTFLLFLLIHTVGFSLAQDRCASTEYVAAERLANPRAAERMAAAETFLHQKSSQARTAATDVIRIPVVVHVIYNNASQNISDAQVKSQIDALNRDYRRRNPDTLNTPSRFRAIAADIQIEFYLATTDPNGRPTTGIVRKQTSVANWLTNDKIKFSSQNGDDAWDSKSYLNIWVGNLIAGAGYSSAPGSDPAKDGLVITTSAFGTLDKSGSYYSLGRTAVHESAHWLGLRHIWGDAQCGDDGIGDTPQQGWYTTNCPSGFRSSCTNGELGDMYMNYMDYTADACVNLFTEGQKTKMRVAFAPGGPRESLLQSKGLEVAEAEKMLLPETAALGAVAYPNPASDVLNLNLGTAGVGKTVSLFGSNGNLVQVVAIKTAVQKIALTALRPGIYFIKGDGVSVRFAKL